MDRSKIAPGLAVALILALAVAAAGCGGGIQPTAPAARTGSGTGAVTYSGGSPEDAASLLKAAADAVKAKVSPDLGVHFTMDLTTTTVGKSISSQAEGDMVYPDRIRMTSQTLTGGQPQKTDFIMVGGNVYERTGSGAWQSSPAPVSRPLGLASITNYIDYARSSRFFGQESLKGGLKTYHVQIDVDTKLEAEEAEKNAAAPSLRQSLEALKSAAVTVDLWIGIDDHLIYQENVKSVNSAQALNSLMEFRFSNWGEPVQIKEPY